MGASVVYAGPAEDVGLDAWRLALIMKRSINYQAFSESPFPESGPPRTGRMIVHRGWCRAPHNLSALAPHTTGSGGQRRGADPPTILFLQCRWGAEQSARLVVRAASARHSYVCAAVWRRRPALLNTRHRPPPGVGGVYRGPLSGGAVSGCGPACMCARLLGRRRSVRAVEGSGQFVWRALGVVIYKIHSLLV